MRTMYRHTLKKYAGRITLIVNEKQYKFDKKHGLERALPTGGLEVHSTPGDHWTRFGLHGEEFAKQVAECLNEAAKEQPTECKLAV